MEPREINTTTLRKWLDTDKKVNIIDIRPAHERNEWHIPGSIHMDVQEQLKRNDQGALKSIALDKGVPVVTVCAGGKSSLIASGFLQKAGYDAYSLQGGMKSWSLAWNTASVSFDNFEIIQFRRTGKGCLSYLVISGNEAMMFDASLPVEVYQKALVQRKLTLKHAADTHIHADHLSRSKELADLFGIDPSMPANDKLSYSFIPVLDGTGYSIGDIKIKAIHTPGHTLESTCFMIDGKVLLTGDTLFTNGVGRPDLKSSQEEATEKSKMLFRSLTKLMDLDKSVMLMPGHTNRPVAFDRQPIQSTLKEVVETTPLLKESEEEFVQSLLNRIPNPPENYLKIVDKNISANFTDISAADLEAGANRCAIS